MYQNDDNRLERSRAYLLTARAMRASMTPVPNSDNTRKEALARVLMLEQSDHYDPWTRGLILHAGEHLYHHLEVTIARLKADELRVDIHQLRTAIGDGRAAFSIAHVAGCFRRDEDEFGIMRYQAGEPVDDPVVADAQIPITFWSDRVAEMPCGVEVESIAA